MSIEIRVTTTDTPAKRPSKKAVKAVDKVNKAALEKQKARHEQTIAFLDRMIESNESSLEQTRKHGLITRTQRSFDSVMGIEEKITIRRGGSIPALSNVLLSFVELKDQALGKIHQIEKELEAANV